MPSINLLPKHIKLKNKLSERRKGIFVVSFFLVTISVISYLGVYIDRSSASNEVNLLNSRLETLDKDIRNEIDNNNSPLMEEKIKDITLLLDEHHYYSKAFRLVQNIIIDNAYLASSDFSIDKENLILSIEGNTENYLVAVDQIAALKNSYWFDDVEFDNIVAAGEGEVKFSAKMKLKKDLILYHRHYWDFGLALLSSKTNRYLKINEYSAVLKEAANQENFIEVKFSGIAYDEEKLESLENDLREMEIFVKEVSVFYDLNKKESSGAINFSGEMELNF
jgi:Tfp pilus assembly protein PilN